MSDFRVRLNRRLTAHFPAALKRNHSRVPLASISFDDFPRSAWTNGGKILRRHGIKGTYYAVGGYAGRTVEGIEQYRIEDLQAAAREGHEIASHTFCHRPVTELSNESIQDDEHNNIAFLRTHLPGHEVTGFAYPYGEASIRTKLRYAKLYRVCRGIRKGINGTWFDSAQLKAVGIEKLSWTKERIEEAIHEAITTNGWLILFTHDVTDEPANYGATPAMLEHAVVSLKAAGIEILPVYEAYRRTQAR